MAKQTCTPCLHHDVKELLAAAFPDLEELLGKVADCQGEVRMELCLDQNRKRARGPRAEFMSSCLKSKNIQGFADAPRAMKECSTEWRAKQVT